MDFGTALTRVREGKPLVQCITNFVTVNDCANIILAAGGSPTMASHPLEVEEAVAGVRALVCNLGAIEKLESMLLAGKEANRRGIPVVLDPVGGGGTRLRREALHRLLAEVRFAVIRGNASEIRYLAGLESNVSGVDAGDTVGESDYPALRALAEKTGGVIAVSGETDVVCDANRTMLIHNGCATLARITGSGCMLAALTGAFCGANDPFPAACAATAALGICGEIAEARRLKNGTGNATFRNDLIDAVFNLTPGQLEKGVRYELYEN